MRICAAGKPLTRPIPPHDVACTHAKGACGRGSSFVTTTWLFFAGLQQSRKLISPGRPRLKGVSFRVQTLLYQVPEVWYLIKNKKI